jgi:protein involved in polysaccharide export with SLBB domain
MRIDLTATAAAPAASRSTDRRPRMGAVLAIAVMAFGSPSLTGLTRAAAAGETAADSASEMTLEIAPEEGAVAQAAPGDVPAAGGGVEIAPQPSRVAAAGTTPPEPTLGLMDYKLDRGDRVRVRFFNRFDREDLNGDYTIGDNGQLRLPKLGLIQAAGRTTAEIEAAIRDLLTSRKERPGTFTVDVVQTRPIFVTGLANRPGAYAFASGYTVLNAVSLAGGLYRSASSPEAEAVKESGRSNEYKKRLEEQLAKRARFQAQRGSRDIIMPAELKRLNPDSAGDVIEQEQAILDDLRQEKGDRRSNLQQIISLTQKEIAGHQRELSATSGRIGSREQEVRTLTRLYKRGLLKQERLDTVLQGLDSVRRDRALTSADLARARTTLARAKLELKELELVNGSTLGEKIATADAEISRLKKQIDDAGRVVTTLKQMSGIAAQDAKATYRIVRRGTNGGMTTIQANEGTPLQPGDIVDIAIRTAGG